MNQKSCSDRAFVKRFVFREAKNMFRILQTATVISPLSKVFMALTSLSTNSAISVLENTLTFLVFPLFIFVRDRSSEFFMHLSDINSTNERHLSHNEAEY
jgi:hypothetical protein